MHESTANHEHGRLFSLAAKWWHDWKARRVAVSELDCCGADEVAHLARDVGVSPSELHTLAGRWPDSADLLPRRMAAVGLDNAQISRTEPQVMRDLERVCTQCAGHSRCQHDLDRDDKDRVWRDYCPNVATLDALKSENRDRRLMRRSPKWRSF